MLTINKPTSIRFKVSKERLDDPGNILNDPSLFIDNAKMLIGNDTMTQMLTDTPYMTICLHQEGYIHGII